MIYRELTGFVTIDLQDGEMNKPLDPLFILCLMSVIKELSSATELNEHVEEHLKDFGYSYYEWMDDISIKLNLYTERFSAWSVGVVRYHAVLRNIVVSDKELERAVDI